MRSADGLSLCPFAASPKLKHFKGVCPCGAFIMSRRSYGRQISGK